MTEMPPMVPSPEEQEWRDEAEEWRGAIIGGSNVETLAEHFGECFQNGFTAGVQAERNSTDRDQINYDEGRRFERAAIIARPAEWLTWAIETFGEIARDPTERCLRFVEEAIELAQAMGLSDADLCRIITRVLGREPGTPAKEIAQAQACLETLALVLGVDADAGATAELARVKSIPREEWKRRHAAKVAIGIAR